jgi:uncharacterized protein (DUF433 family)
MLNVEAEAIPLKADADGVLRVGGTRVSLDSVVAAFELGSTPEQIVQSYDALELDQVYAVITYYLRHREAVTRYLDDRQEKRDSVRQEIQAVSPTAGLRERLLKRRQKKDS